MRAYQAKTGEARYGDQVLLHEVALLQGVCKNTNNRNKWRYTKKVKKLEGKTSIVAGGGKEKLKITVKMWEICVLKALNSGLQG